MGRYQVDVGGERFEVELRTIGGKERATVWRGSSREEVIVTLHGDGELEIRRVDHEDRLRVVPLTSGDGSEVRMVARGLDVIAVVSSERDRLRSLNRAGTTGPRRHIVASEIPGIVRSVRVRLGEKIGKGAPLLTLEAMKMENELQAPAAGRIKAVLVEPGAVVAAGEPLLEIETSD